MRGRSGRGSLGPMWAGIRAVGWGAALVSLAGLSSLAVGASREDREETYRKLAIFARVLNHIQNSYVEPTDPEALIYAAVGGVVSALDARSAFLTPAEVADLRREARRAHFDLGFGWDLRDDVPIVTQVRPGSPAAQRGVAPGLRIVRIDEEPAPTDSPEALEDALFDLAEDIKRLDLQDDQGATVTVRLRFAELRRPTVEARPGPEGTHYLRIDRFTEDTPLELLEALERARPIRGLVLDLRGNSGGVVEAAARVADAWISEGIIATTEARGRELERFVAHQHGTEPAYPMAVLVDRETASAAELVAAGLQESGRARVVGEPTYGKGTVQTVIELEDGSALRITISRWFTGQHHSVEGEGVRPDHVTPSADAATRVALQIAAAAAAR